ncbi:MAG: isochorismatase family cysteine hydrolase [Nitrososphaerales archaeon]|jgi:nicotinamidase-related amidase
MTSEKRKPGEFTADYQLQKARRDYEAGRATIKIDPRKSALIVVDMIEEFTKPNFAPLWVPEATKIIPRVKALIEAFRKEGAPVIYTYYTFNSTFTDMNPWFREAWAPIDKTEDYDGPPLFTRESVDPAIKPDYTKDIMISKPSYGAFTNTSLDYILKNLGMDTVVICGTMTNYCCGTTAREAHARGYKVVFGSDCNATDDATIQEAELKTLRRGFSLVISTDEIVDAISGIGEFAASKLPGVD